jgi:hypothetical protein
MSTHSSVEVFLGNSIDISSEAKFLARLERDLHQRGMRARILANLQFDRQVDFLIVTPHRTVQVELKTVSGPIVAAPKNGNWTVRIGGSDVSYPNAGYQARQAAFAVSDVLQAFAARTNAPGPTKTKFYEDIDTVVCVYPALPAGSCQCDLPHVRIVGYDELLVMLGSPGRRVPWSPQDWDAFGRRHNLYRADEDTAEGVVRRMGASAVDAYLGHFRSGREELPPLVGTAVMVRGERGARPDLARRLQDGACVLVHGRSGHGKSLWARHVALDLAAAGQVPVWISAELGDDSLRTSIARAISPYTSLAPDELLRAADAAGRVVVLVIDDLTRATPNVRQALLHGAEAVRRRRPSCGLLLTAQTRDDVPMTDLLAVELPAPNTDERAAVLEAYGAAHILELCDGFVTPLELSLAASAAGALAAGASATSLLDAHVDHATAGDDRLRAALRAAAYSMHVGLDPAPPRPRLARTLQRNYGLDDELGLIWDCPLLDVAHGRVRFSHERFERFLAAEHLLLDGANLGDVLNEPRHAPLRRDVVALEDDPDRCADLLRRCEDAAVIVDAAMGHLGPIAMEAGTAVLDHAIKEAIETTNGAEITFEVQHEHIGIGTWHVPDPISDAAPAKLRAIGRLLALGRPVPGIGSLFDATDALIKRIADESDEDPRLVVQQAFAAAYALGPDSLPATAITQAVFGSWSTAPVDPRAVSDLLQHAPAGPSGRLYLVAELARFGVAPLSASLIVRCLRAGRYHLVLLGLQLAEFARVLGQSERNQVIAAVRAIETDNMMLSSAVVEALAVLGELEPIRDRDDIGEEIARVLAAPHDPLACQLAAGIVSNQFENDVVGPYYEAVSELAPDDRQRLLTMALTVDGFDGFNAAWIVNELEDLSDAYTRATVENCLASANPEKWFMPHEGMEATVAALGLLARANRPLPKSSAGGSTDPGWRAGLLLLLAAQADDRSRLDGAWTTMLEDHRHLLPGLLASAHRTHHLDRGRNVELHSKLMDSMPDDAIPALLEAIASPEALRPLCRHDGDVRGYLIDLMARLGEPRATPVLRRLADDRTYGSRAATAVRVIETGQRA